MLTEGLERVLLMVRGGGRGHLLLTSDPVMRLSVAVSSCVTV